MITTRLRLLGTLLTGAILAVLSSTPAQADALADIQSRGVLKVAVPQDFPPFGSVGPDLSPRGLDIDTAKLIADKLGVKLQLTAVSSANRIPYLTTGKVDLVISSLGKTPEREKVIAFSRKYAPFYMGIFGPKEIDVSKPADLVGKSVGVTRGALEDIEVSKIAPEGTLIKRFEDNNSNIQAYLSGQTQLISSGNYVMSVISEKSPDRQALLKFKVKDSGCYVGMNLDETALLDKVNQIIAQAKDDGTLNAMNKQWLDEDLPADF